MWYQSESSVKPEAEDLTSSQNYNYARKNIRVVEREGMNGEKTVMYVYDEICVTKNDWWLFKQNEALQEQLAEQADALVELASIIAEVE